MFAWGVEEDCGVGMRREKGRRWRWGGGGVGFGEGGSMGSMGNRMIWWRISLIVMMIIMASLLWEDEISLFIGSVSGRPDASLKAN